MSRYHVLPAFLPTICRQPCCKNGFVPGGGDDICFSPKRLRTGVRKITSRQSSAATLLRMSPLSSPEGVS